MTLWVAVICAAAIAIRMAFAVHSKLATRQLPIQSEPIQTYELAMWDEAHARAHMAVPSGPAQPDARVFRPFDERMARVLGRTQLWRDAYLALSRESPELRDWAKSYILTLVPRDNLLESDSGFCTLSEGGRVVWEFDRFAGTWVSTTTPGVTADDGAFCGEFHRRALGTGQAWWGTIALEIMQEIKRNPDGTPARKPQVCFCRCPRSVRSRIGAVAGKPCPVCCGVVA